MEKGFFVLALLLAGTVACEARREVPGKGNRPPQGEQYNTGAAGNYTSDTLIITYSKDEGPAALLAAARTYGATVLYTYNVINAIAVRKPAGKTLNETIARFKKVKGVIRVERDAIMQTQGGSTSRTQVQ